MEEASGVVMVWVVLFVVTRFLEFWFLRGFLRYVVSFQWLGRCCVEGRMSREWRRRQVSFSEDSRFEGRGCMSSGEKGAVMRWVGVQIEAKRGRGRLRDGGASKENMCFFPV